MPSSPSSPRPASRGRSALAAVATLALVAVATLLAPTTASSQTAPSVDPADGPLYADGVVRFSGTCPENEPGDGFLDVELTFSDPSFDRTTTASVDGTTWTAASGFLGSDEALTMTVTIDCSGEGPVATRTFDLLAPSVALDLTVGTEEGECADTSSIEVTAGTTVYWCYTLTSLSGRFYNGHTLVDDVDGTILDEVDVGLAGGESVSSVELGLDLSDTVTDDLVRTGTWALLGCDGFCVPFDDDTASAAVTVIDGEAPPTTEVDEPTDDPPPAATPEPAAAPAARPVAATPTYTG